MKQKNSRIETLKMLISSRQLRSQEEVLNALIKEGITSRRLRSAATSSS